MIIFLLWLPFPSFPFCEPVGDAVADEDLVLEAVGFGFVVEVVEVELVVVEALAATTNLSPYAFAPAESVSARKNVLPGTAKDPGVQEYEFELMLAGLSQRALPILRGSGRYLTRNWIDDVGLRLSPVVQCDIDCTGVAFPC